MEETSSKVESLHAVAVAKGGPAICALCTRVCDASHIVMKSLFTKSYTRSIVCL